ncbi:MAG: hypothetical protein WC484_08005 [Candidatus Omnitrophota bacterium]
MININEDKWDDIKRDFLSEIEYEFSEEPLIYFDHKTNTQEEIGTRETYTFTKNDMDIMVIMDKERRLTKTSSEKDGKQKDHYRRSLDEYTYKLSVKFRDKDGSWKDSSALEGNFE